MRDPVAAQTLEPPRGPGSGSGDGDQATRRVVPYPHIREADAMWCKRVWRDIDMAEKINLPLFYPPEPANGLRNLFDLIVQALLQDGSITAFDAGADGWHDAFDTPLSTARVEELLARSDTIVREGLDGGVDTVIVVQRVTGDDIRRYRIKEDRIFDKQRSEMDIRIIGLAPLALVRGEDGELRGYKPLFWLYFPELRYVLANAPAFNRHNAAEQRSLDHVFLTRMFSSTIVKESNVQDRPISAYKTGADGMLESDRIEQGLFELEQDLWHY